MEQFSGRPQVRVGIVDESTLPSRAGASTFLMQCVTQIGKINEPQLILDENDYYRKLGQVVHPTSEEAIIALRGGARLIINPIGHLNIEPVITASTPDGVKASATITLGAATLTITAEEVGEGYNGFSLQIREPQSKQANKFDIAVIGIGMTGIHVVRDVDSAIKTADIAELNEKLKFVSLSLSADTTLEVASATLTSGERNIDDIVPLDIMTCLMIGFPTEKRGEYIANVYYSTPEIDAAYIALGEATDRTVILPMPMELTAEEVAAYREATGSYTHTPFDTLNGYYIRGKLNVRSVQDPTRTLWIQGVGNVIAAESRKDRVAPWFSIENKDYGTIQNALLIEEFSDNEHNLIYEAGVNFIYRDKKGRVRISGNRSLVRDQNKFISKRNIAQLALYLKRWLLEFGEDFMGETVDIKLARDMYRQALPTLNDVVNRRGVFGFIWEGDQNASNLDSLSYNIKSDMLLGIYRAKLSVRPTATLEYLGITIALTDRNLTVTIEE